MILEANLVKARAEAVAGRQEALPQDWRNRQYPGLKPADVHDALAYAYDHLEEIEADLAADDEATVKAQHSAGKSGP